MWTTATDRGRTEMTDRFFLLGITVRVMVSIITNSSLLPVPVPVVVIVVELIIVVFGLELVILAEQQQYGTTYGRTVLRCATQLKCALDRAQAPHQRNKFTMRWSRGAKNAPKPLGHRWYVLISRHFLKPAHVCPPLAQPREPKIFPCLVLLWSDSGFRI